MPLIKTFLFLQGTPELELRLQNRAGAFLRMGLEP